jgi:hypothetical protein
MEVSFAAYLAQWSNGRPLGSWCYTDNLGRTLFRRQMTLTCGNPALWAMLIESARVVKNLRVKLGFSKTLLAQTATASTRGVSLFG